ncbi:MAG: hypothetical protein E6X17_01085 [Sporomusaceae bacterium]|nr:hypothetical protein [Sporomusaceae bacterium]
MDALHTLIAESQLAIFSYRLDLFTERFLELIDLLTAGMQSLTVEEQENLNSVLQVLLTAYEGKDYLLVADLLEFELKPLIGTV